MPANEDAPAEKTENSPQNAQGVFGGKVGWQDTGGEKGRGVFARVDIAKGEMIEVAPVIPVGTHNIPDDGGAPDGYLLDWDPETVGAEHCICGGYIMLYNHDKNANATLENDYEAVTITSFALRDIKAGEEIVWDYSCDIWFDEESSS